MAKYRRRTSNPAFGAGSRGASVARVVDYSSAQGTSWPPDRVLMPNDTIATLGALSSLLSIYGGPEAGSVATLLGPYLAIAQRITHNRSEPAAAARVLNTFAAMLAGHAQSEAEFDQWWRAIGRAARGAVQSWPENLAAGYWRAVQSIVEQVTVAQMPGYMFGQPFNAPMPPLSGPILPRGEPPNPSNQGIGGSRATGGASQGSASTQDASWASSLAQAGINNADILGPIAGAVIGGAFGPGGSALGATAGEALGQLVKQRYGTNPSAAQVAQAAQDLKTSVEADQGSSPPQQPLPGFGGAQPQSAPVPNPATGGQTLIPANYGGGETGIGGQLGNTVGAAVGGIVGMYGGNTQTQQAFTQLGGLTGQGIQAGVVGIDRNT